MYYCENKDCDFTSTNPLPEGQKLDGKKVCDGCYVIEQCESENHPEERCYGDIWTCEGCRRKFCYQEGADDEDFELCDDCSTSESLEVYTYEPSVIVEIPSKSADKMDTSEVFELVEREGEKKIDEGFGESYVQFIEERSVDQIKNKKNNG